MRDKQILFIKLGPTMGTFGNKPYSKNLLTYYHRKGQGIGLRPIKTSGNVGVMERVILF
jgi:hypothetical protein